VLSEDVNMPASKIIPDAIKVFTAAKDEDNVVPNEFKRKSKSIHEFLL
jgi:hypothetical protein